MLNGGALHKNPVGAFRSSCAFAVVSLLTLGTLQNRKQMHTRADRSHTDKMSLECLPPLQPNRLFSKRGNRQDGQRLLRQCSSAPTALQQRSLTQGAVALRAEESRTADVKMRPSRSHRRETP
mmetsp:Transcript_34368/g.67949  ORF Transcript_34368/g.67949 Transcript_34368/m.67949 type:complete len:123 (-) Transcript_34368:882-1250(-)